MQDNLLARVIFGDFVCENEVADFWRFELPCFFLEFLHLELWLYGRVHIVINIGDFSEKTPIANINSSPINCLVRYHSGRYMKHEYCMLFIATSCLLNSLTTVTSGGRRRPWVEKAQDYSRRK